MKKNILMLTLSAMLALSGCGQEAAGSTGESRAAVESSAEQPMQDAAAKEEKASADKESASASGATAAQKKSGKIDKVEATATPEPAQKTETSPTEKPVATTVPGTTKAPASTPKADKLQGSTQTSAGNAATSSPASAPVVSAPTPEPHTQCTWDGGSVTKAATCSSEGTKTYTCTVCGATRTESIPKTAHNYVTETKAATCTEAGSTKTYCSICGDVQSETSSGAALGHDFQKSYWPSAPTCMNGGYYNLTCSRCGEHGGEGSDPALPHTPVSTEICHGDCVSQTIIVTTCSVCGLELGRDAHFEDEGHNWVTGTSQPIWDEASHSFITYEVTYCTKCGAQK